jgi:2-oxoisovalerate dehydrogenase E1 component alpha subunit
VRVLDDENRAVGPWNPKLDAETLRRMLRMMALTRAFDDRMYRGQRQGKTSFYMKCTGEEAPRSPRRWRWRTMTWCSPAIASRAS